MKWRASIGVDLVGKLTRRLWEKEIGIMSRVNSKVCVCVCVCACACCGGCVCVKRS